MEGAVVVPAARADSRHTLTGKSTLNVVQLVGVVALLIF
jgi:hypothetical protein